MRMWMLGYLRLPSVGKRNRIRGPRRKIRWTEAGMQAPRLRWKNRCDSCRKHDSSPHMLCENSNTIHFGGKCDVRSRHWTGQEARRLECQLESFRSTSCMGIYQQLIRATMLLEEAYLISDVSLFVCSWSHNDD